MLTYVIFYAFQFDYHPPRYLCNLLFQHKNHLIKLIKHHHENDPYDDNDDDDDDNENDGDEDDVGLPGLV